MFCEAPYSGSNLSNLTVHVEKLTQEGKLAFMELQSMLLCMGSLDHCPETKLSWYSSLLAWYQLFVVCIFYGNFTELMLAILWLLWSFLLMLRRTLFVHMVF